MYMLGGNLGSLLYGDVSVVKMDTLMLDLWFGGAKLPKQTLSNSVSLESHFNQS